MIVIELLKDDSYILDEYTELLLENEASIIESKEFFGGEEVQNLIIQLSPYVIVAVSSIVINLIKARKHVSIKKDGFEITGITEDNALKVLEEIMKKEEQEKITQNKQKSNKR